MDRGGQGAAVGSGGVEIGVVDRELQAHRAAGGDGGAESHGQFVVGEAVGPGIVDGPHDRFVEHVGVDVDPESAVRAVVAGQVGDGVTGRRGGAQLTDPVTVDDRHDFREWLAVAPVPVGGVAAGEHDHIVVADQRPPLLQVTHHVRAPARDEGEIRKCCGKNVPGSRSPHSAQRPRWPV